MRSARSLALASMVLLFADIYLVKRAFPQKFEEVRVRHREAPSPTMTPA